MTINQVKYFVTVADYLSFTQAAEHLYVSQQVISKQIKQLEIELGFSLFVRDKRNVALTEGGKMLYHHWSVSLKEYYQVVSDAYRIMNKKEKLVRIGTIDVSRIYDWIATAVTNVCTAQKIDGQFRVNSASYIRLYQGLLDGRFDCIISLADENRNLSDDYEETIIFNSYPKLVISDNHPKYHEGMVLDELKDEILYVFSSSFSQNAAKNIKNHCISVGIHPENIEEFDEISSMEMELYAGKGYAITYDLFFRNPVNNLHFIEVDEAISEFASGFSIAYPKSKKSMLLPFIEAYQAIFQ